MVGAVCTLEGQLHFDFFSIWVFGFLKTQGSVQGDGNCVLFVAGQGDNGSGSKGFLADIAKACPDSLFSIALSLVVSVDHQMPEVVFTCVIVKNHHNITNHGIPGVDTERGALVVVNICLGKAADGMGDKVFLAFCQFQIEAINKISLVDSL